MIGQLFTSSIGGTIIAGGSKSGNQADQLTRPTCIVLDKKTNSLIISDRGNRRVVRWLCENAMVGQTIIPNMDADGLALDNAGYLYISDRNKHEVRRWRIGDSTGVIVAGGNEVGDRLDQLNDPRHIFVDENHSIYISNRKNHRVMKWTKDAKEGIVVAGGHGMGNSLMQLHGPEGIVVDPSGTVYVADHNNHRIVQWSEGDTQGSIIIDGNQLRHPVGLSFDEQGNLYVADMSNHRVQKFPIHSV